MIPQRRLVRRFATIAIMLAATSAIMAAEAEISLKPTLGRPFADHAVLQQKMAVPVWGRTLPGANVTVAIDKQTQSTVADPEGQWRVELDPMTAIKLKSVNDTPTGMVMTVTCRKDGEQAVSEITNIIMGDVWVCAGQSNMAGSMRRAVHPKNYPPDSIPKANYPALRLLGKAEWMICSPETAVRYSRVAFYFARALQREVLVPIGLLHAAVGGSNIESWLNQAPYEQGKHYTKLITPLVGYGIKGAIWYQGESNAKDKRAYQPKLESLITGWRNAWNQGDFPFHYVQLPGIGSSPANNPAMGDGRAEIRQAYIEALRLKNTGLAVTIDIGTPGEHPPNKYDTGERLARSVLHDVYGRDDVAVSPLYKSHRVEGNAIRVRFANADSGLMMAQKQGPLDFQSPKPTPDATVNWLAIQDQDGVWYWADGTIDGAELIVSVKGVKHPKAVRYAYTTHPTGPLLYNKDGLPVGPFSTIGYGEADK